jgi:hypothetical protein
MIHFRIAPHAFRTGIEIVEIFEGDQLVGALYPHPRGVQLISKYLKEEGVTFIASIPSVLEIRLP